MKKEQLLEKLKAAETVSSNVFFPVADVIKMVEDLETEYSELDDTMISDIAHEIAFQLDHKDVVDEFNIDADVSGNNVSISISSVTFDRYEVEATVEKAIEKVISKSKSEVYN